MSDDRDDDRNGEPPAPSEGEGIKSETEEPPQPEVNVDAQLLERWRQGDERAWNELYQRLGPMVTAFFRARVHPNETQDLIQTTFMGFVRGRDRIRNDLSVRSYVYGIAEKTLYKHFDQNTRNQAVKSIDPTVDSAEDLRPGMMEHIEGRQEARLLVAGLRRLSLKDQSMFELYYIQSWRLADIADHHGIAHSTMRTRIGTIRERLESNIRKLEASPALIDSTIEGLVTWANRIHDLNFDNHED